ncbi:MAG: hypothetical protein WBJ75_03350 [Pseudohongiellaceae bacterium]
MSESSLTSQSSAIAAAHDAGRRLGLATAALALSAVSFLNLLGFEKSILAIVLAALAIRGITPVGVLRLRTRLAFGIGALHLATISIILTVFQEELREFLGLLYELN